MAKETLEDLLRELFEAPNSFDRKRLAQLLPEVPVRQRQSLQRSVLEKATQGDSDPLLRRDQKKLENAGVPVQLLRLLGSGVSGRVWQARYVRFGEQVQAAVKLTGHKSKTYGSRLDELLMEATIQQTSCHPNVVQLYEVVPFVGLVMELVPGGSLKQKLANSPRISWHFALRICLDVAKAVQFMHNQTPALLHLDLKPDNILVNEWSVRAKVIVKVADPVIFTHRSVRK